MSDTTNLQLPLIEAAQAQKHVTHNEAILGLDVLAQLVVKDRDLTAPPGSPADGDTYIPATGASGDWSGHDDDIAVWQDGVWKFYDPKAGWVGFVQDEGLLVYWTGSAWTGVTGVMARAPNILINGGFDVWQRGTSFTAATAPANTDDTYLADRFVLLSDGNDIVDVSQETAVVPQGAAAACKLDVQTANKKFGLLQIVEAKDAAAVIGGTASLSFKARAGGSNVTLDKLRCAILSWTGTADSVTSDVVSAWNAEGADPTLAANWTMENTPSDLALTASYQTFKIEGIAIDAASAANVAVFIWVDNDDATMGDAVYIADILLEPGGTASQYQKASIAAELAKCVRYYQTWRAGQPGWCSAPDKIQIGTGFVPPMRAAPTATLLDTSISIHTQGGASPSSGSTIVVAQTTLAMTGAQVCIDGFSSLTTPNFCLLANDADVASFDAEL